MEYKRKPKPLKDLNLIDRFLFAEAADDPVIVKNLLEIIIGKDIVLKYLPQTEKEQRVSSLYRYVKLDLMAWDVDDVVYDTEVQKENTKNLPKRSRLYQALIDTKLLPPGEVDFNRLNKVYVILIMPFDLFGYGLYQYTFENVCREVPGLKLEDDAVRIFLNTKGTNDSEVSPELIELLRYIENTSEEMSGQCQSERIHTMQKRIAAIKSNEEIGVKYMQAWEEKIIEERRARERGLAEGRAEGKKETLIRVNCLNLKLNELGRVEDIIRAATDAEYQEQLFAEFGL